MPRHDLHAIQQAALSPAARAVYERLVRGTYEIDLERLADALLARFETGPVCCALASAGSSGACPALEGPYDDDGDGGGGDGDDDESLSSAR
jgi:hypothetical protein